MGEVLMLSSSGRFSWHEAVKNHKLLRRPGRGPTFRPLGLQIRPWSTLWNERGRAGFCGPLGTAPEIHAMRKALLPLALAAALAAGRPTFLDQVWSLLTAAWSEEGCRMDPNGLCAPAPRTDGGCIMDPDGR